MPNDLEYVMAVVDMSDRAMRPTLEVDGWCSRCDCLTSRQPTCWNCGATGLDFNYRSKVPGGLNLKDGMLLSELLSDKVGPHVDEAEEAWFEGVGWVPV